ncbi:hypothetical protein N9492_00075 [Flavobacteriaceae bacterium]|nr:hypothetical protein [Flavobacteriaceae bacterium]MDA7716765.1 hypothetical protein [Flavobacteriaceae bacterium]MDB4023707.1 hypothetical protein [Flavobacteriaceae bacterium]MDB4059998.1 hypothetical protein [Flavobacteriaceae bacterium]MDB4131341.1 hypothetical protein [Flavobacteriaceae bacterium]
MNKLKLILIVFCLGFSVHKYYVSTSLFNFTDSNSLQITVRLFKDDFKEAFKKKYSINRVLTDQVLIDSTFHSNINNYFNSFLTVSFDGVKNKLDFLGLENKNEMFVFYLEIEKLPSFNVISLDNKLLFDLYSEQQNIIHVKKNGIKKSFISRMNNSILSLNI